MKAIIYHQYGSFDNLLLTDIEKPQIKGDEILIAVKAASINQMDVKIPLGKFKMLTGKKFPKQVGSDFSGIVVEVGEEVKNLKQGDEVFGYVVNSKGKRGTFAEYFVARHDQVAIKPSSISHEVAASLACVYQTALQGLRDVAKIKRGERVLIFGASGGVGTAAIQLAKYFGAEIVTISSAANKAYCIKQGASLALAFDEGDMWDELPRDFDVIFQVFETDENLFKRFKTYLKKGGRFMVSPNIKHIIRSLFAIIKKSYRVVMVKGNAKDLDFLGILAAENIVAPDIELFSIEDFKKAYQLLTTGKRGRGKMVLQFK